MVKRIAVRAVVAVGSMAMLSSCALFTTGAERAESGGGGEDALSGKVYLLTPNSEITRFDAYDGPAIEDYFAENAPDLELVIQSADNDPSRQLQQAQAAIAQGAKMIIMAPPVPDQSQSVVEVAHSAGVKVINYAFASTNSDIDYYVTVPFEPIGEQAAQYMVDQTADAPKPLRVAHITGDPSFFFDTEIVSGVNSVLDPLVESGDVEIVCENDNLQLSTDNARRATEACLQQGDVDAVIAHNDSSVNGVIAALSAQDLLGQVQVYGGYDGQAGTIQQLLAGNLENDALPPYQDMAESAAELTIRLLKDDGSAEDLVNGSYDTGSKDVPTIFNDNVFVTRDNVDETIVDTGVLTREEICAGVATSSDFCAG